MKHRRTSRRDRRHREWVHRYDFYDLINSIRPFPAFHDFILLEYRSSIGGFFEPVQVVNLEGLLK